MLAPLALLTLCQFTFLPVAGPGELDGNYGQLHTGSEFLVLYGDAISRRSTLSGAMIAPATPVNVELSAPPKVEGGELMLFSQDFIERYSLPSLTPLPTLNSTGYDSILASHMPSAGGNLVLMRRRQGQDVAEVWDLNTQSLAYAFTARSVGPQENSESQLALDDRTLLYCNEFSQPRKISAFDITTGVETASFALNGSVPRFTDSDWINRKLIMSSDRSTIAVQSRTTGPTITHLVVLDALTLSPLQRWQVPTFVFNYLELSPDGSAVFAISDRGHERFDVASGASQIIDPNPGERSILMMTSSGAVTASRGEPLKVFDLETGALLASVDGEFPFSRYLRVASRGDSDVVIFRDYDRYRLEVYRINGAQTALISSVNDGNRTDADPPFHMAHVPADGRLVVAAEATSNLRIFDGLTETAYVEVGERPIRVTVISPQRAAVLCAEEPSVDLIDLNAGQLRDRWLIPGKPREMEVHGSDVWVRVDEPSPQVFVLDSSGTQWVLRGIIAPAGEMGPQRDPFSSPETIVFDSARGIAYVASSPTGRIERFNTQSLQPLGDRDLGLTQGVVHITLSPNGEWLAVSTDHGRSAEVTMLREPYQSMAIQWAGSFSQTSTSDDASGQSAFYEDDHFVIDARTRLRVRASDAAIIGPPPTMSTLRMGHFEVSNGFLVTGWSALGRVDRIHGRELQLTLEGTVNTYDNPWARPEFDPSRGRLYESRSEVPQGIRIHDLSVTSTDRICSPAITNATGQPASLQASGLPLVGQSLSMTSSGLAPGSMVGYLVVGSSSMSPIVPTGAIGQLCLGGQIGRFVQQAQAANSSGTASFVVDTQALPLVSGASLIEPGETWVFQHWYRDSQGGVATSNFSDALAVTFY